MWIDQICRLCAQISEVLFPIFQKDGDKPRLDLKIKKCLALMVSEEDCKPKQICYNCSTKLEDYYDFLEICQSSDYKFESILFAANTTTESVDHGDLLSRSRWDVEKMVSLSEEIGRPDADDQQAMSHDGVIVVSKMDEAQNMNRECQDILLMVELKYKDVEVPFDELKAAKHVSYEIDDKHALFSQSVLRHSDDFTKMSDSDNNKCDTTTDGIQQIEKSAHYYEQPKEISMKPNYVMKSKPFPCTHCNKSFMRRSNLNAHMSTHTQIRPFSCKDCDRSFALRWNLTVHERLHTGIYTCEFCGKPFPVKGKLERHRRIHTGEKPFTCNLVNCDKAFADKRNLEAHIRTHSEERPYICNLCARGFRSKSHLSDHQRVHSADTPFTCDFCGKSFKWKTNLTIHLKSHTGEKSVCADCGKQFNRPTQLMKHKRVHHEHLNAQISDTKILHS